MTPNTNSRASSPCAAGASVTPFASAQPNYNKRGRIWTPEENERVVKMYMSGVSAKVIAMAFGVTTEAIEGRLTYWGVRRGIVRNAWTEADFAKVAEMRKAGMGVAEIARHYGRSRNSITGALGKLRARGML